MTKTSAVKIYYTASRQRYLLTGTGVAALAIFLFVLITQSFGNWATSIVLVILGSGATLIAVLLFHASRSRIITSALGLAYHTTGFSVFTTWDNIERIDQIPMFQDVARSGFKKDPLIGFAGQFEGLLLRQPVEIKPSIWERGAKGTLRHIVLSIEFATWRESGLAQDFKQYAPHLFSDQT